MQEMRILSPTAILGYGFPMESFQRAMDLNPHVIAVDAGSTDPGPHYLGSGKSFTDRNAVKRDLSIMIPAALERGIPVIIGSAGGSGADSHLDWNVDIIKEISKELNIEFKLGIINSELSKETIKNKLDSGDIRPIFPAKQLEERDINESERIVAQMGFEPFIKALEMGAEVIVAGRAYDPAVFASLAVKNGYDIGLAVHLGKILECAAIAATPGSGSDCMMGFLGEDYFKIMPLSDNRKCTTLSVAAHTLYEKSDPIHLPGPGGELDLTNTTFEQFNENTVIVKGSKFVPSVQYSLKLESARKTGYRTVSIAACKDPIMINAIDTIIEEVKAKVKSNFANFGMDDFFLDFKVYGKNGVMGIFKNLPKETSHELCIIIEAVAKDQKQADTICSFARSTMLHYGYEGRKSTAGNLAFPFSPSDFSVGEVYEFNMYHLMDVDNPADFFPISVKNCKGGELA
ncbi:MAG: DUF1446 domain-containing protein [Defluviitaleaceae bacterium]|nr:DUF1446 domain-containing protein [Defluviitaleaceae bacterium]